MSERLTAAATALGAAIVFIALLSLIFSEGWLADLLLDRNSTVFPYPLTIQNGMWLLFSGPKANMPVCWRFESTMTTEGSPAVMCA